MESFIKTIYVYFQIFSVETTWNFGTMYEKILSHILVYTSRRWACDIGEIFQNASTVDLNNQIGL